MASACAPVATAWWCGAALAPSASGSTPLGRGACGPWWSVCPESSSALRGLSLPADLTALVQPDADAHEQGHPQRDEKGEPELVGEGLPREVAEESGLRGPQRRAQRVEEEEPP